MTYEIQDSSFHTPIKITKEKVIPARPVADRRGFSGIMTDLQKEKYELKQHIYRLEIEGANPVVVRLARERLFEVVNEIAEKASEYRSRYQVIMPPLFNLPNVPTVKPKPKTNKKSHVAKASKHLMKSQGIFADRKSRRINNKENHANIDFMKKCFVTAL